MATTVQQMHPVAHLPLVLGVLRRLEVATVIDRLSPPHPAPGLTCGRGVEAWVRAILDGHQALQKVGRRLEERGMLALLQPGLTRAALHADRLGHILEALFAANLHKVQSPVALQALEVYALATPWLPQDTTTMALQGAYADAPKTPGAPRPADGQSKDGRDDRKQVLLSLGVSGDGGVPVRLGRRDGNRRERVETPVAMEECLAWGCEGVRGIVADRQASSRRTLGWCLEQGLGLLTVVPRSCAVRQELAAWGQQPPGVPLFVEKPGRTQDEAPRHGHGQSVLRRGEVEQSAGRVAQEERRLVVVQASQLAPPHAQASPAAQAQEAAAGTAHVKQVQARWLACEAAAAAASAASEGRGPGRRGRPPRPWRSHAVRYQSVAETRRTRRTRRGRPAPTDLPPTESGYRLVVEGEALSNREEDKGWTALATTVQAATCTDAESLQAYQEHNTTVAPGLRWIKHPAALAPGWLEKPERIAAFAMLTVRGLLVSSVSQRQVRLSLRTHDQQLPGNKGLTTIPTAAVGLALFAQVALVQLWIDEQEVKQIDGLQPHHRLVCQALGLDSSWYAVPFAQKSGGDG